VTDTNPSSETARSHAEPLRACVQGLALAGGVVMLVVSVLVATNVTLRALLETSVAGAFDLVKIGAAMCVFLCLPLCQARRGNIFVDTFTTLLPGGINRALDALWDVIYGLICAVIGIAMLQGAREQFASHVQTTQLAIPIWPFNLAAGILMLLLAVLCLLTAIRVWKTS
jgi:TRAP-type C4-dicarboxylate transport system permease small subunit